MYSKRGGRVQVNMMQYMELVERVENLEKLLEGARYEKEDISELLKDIEVKEYFGDIPKIEFIELIYGADEL